MVDGVPSFFHGVTAAFRHFAHDAAAALCHFGRPLPPLARPIRQVAPHFATLFRRIQQRRGCAPDHAKREANRLKDEFLAAVSHELRTPLNAILGWVQILGSTKPDEQTTARAVAVITRNVHAQTRVIEDLVDVSRIVTGKLPLKLEALDLRQPVETALEVVRPSAESKRLTLEVHEPDEPCMVTGDRDRLQQVVWNLLTNAIKFTEPDGQVSVSISPGTRTHDVEVRDSGAGIAPEFLPYVFDRFRQADGSMSREHGGLGLGLAIVRDLTEMHGGSVRRARAGIRARASSCACRHGPPPAHPRRPAKPRARSRRSPASASSPSTIIPTRSR